MVYNVNVNMFNNVRIGIAKFFLGNSIHGGMGAFWNWVMPGEWSRTDLLKQYARYVYAIITAIAEESAKIDLVAKRVARGGAKVPVTTHPFLELIKKPNPDTSQFQFLEMHFTFMKLSGESFWYMPMGKRSKQPKEIYLLRPDLMDVSVDQNDKRGLVSGYVLNKADGTKVPFEKHEIIHFKTPNPMNPYRGMGTVQAGKTYIQTEEFGADWTKNSLFNSGRPSGIVNFKGTITDDQFQTLKRQFKSEYSGISNAGKTLLTRGADGIDFQKLGMELNGVALKELKDLTRDDIMVMFRVSKTILGITDDVNRANAREAKTVFRENVIKPEMDRFIDHLNAFAMPIWGDSVFLEYTDPSNRSEEDKVEEWKAGHNKWLTTNDIRAEKGLDPVDGGDVIWQPMNLVPMTEDEKEQPSDDNKGKAKGLKKKEIITKSPACRQANETKEECLERKIPEILEENPGMSQEQAVAIAESLCSKRCRDEKRKQRGEVFRQILFDNQARWEKKYKAVMDKEFEKQRREILANNKKAIVNKELDEWLFDLNASKERMFAVLFPLMVEIMREQSKFAFDIADNPDSELEINDSIRDYISDRIYKLADETNDFTITEIIDSISEGILQGDSLTQLRNRINDIYANATTMRSERIARTETISASNESALQAYRQSPLVNYKEWHAEFDACEFCLAMDGQIIGLDENFAEVGNSITGEDGGHYNIDYLAIDHPPLHPNCRCAILPVID